MLVVIIAAGQAKRLQPITETRLKGSLPILNEPLLLRLVDMIYEINLLDKVILVVSPGQEEAVREIFFRREYYTKLIVTIQDPPKGTADAVAKVEQFIDKEQTFLVLNGDILTPLEKILPKIMKQFQQLQAKCIMVGYPGKGNRYGLFQITKDGKVKGIEEKSQTILNNSLQTYINAGVYLFTREIFEIIRNTPLSKRNEYELTDSITILGNRGIIGAVQTDYWMSIENPIDFFNAQLFLPLKEEQSNLQFHSGSEIGFKAAEDVFFGEGTVINFSTVEIVGPALIGKGTLIEPNSVIGPRVFIGRNCGIASNVIMQESLVMDNVKIGKKSLISSLIAGEEVIIGANTVIQPIPITEKLFSKPRDRERLEEFVIIGGKTIISSNSKLQKGRKISANSVFSINEQ